MRLVNTKRITLNFEVKDVGPSGLSSVELWYTKDCREWKKHDAPTKAKAYVIEVDDEGMYGFTLRARSGIGLGESLRAPAIEEASGVGDRRSLTKPEVRLADVTPGLNPKQQQVTIKLVGQRQEPGPAADRACSGRRSREGPWKVMATNLGEQRQIRLAGTATARRASSSRWRPPTCGNVGRSTQSPRPVLLDTRIPTVSIVNVEANPGH